MLSQAQIAVRESTEKFLLVRGLAGEQDMDAITVFRSPWPICRSFSLPLSSHIRMSGPIRCSSIASVRKRPPSNFSASGNHYRLKNFGKSTLQIPRSGGTIELTR